MTHNNKYIYVGKTLFFPKERVLVIGDLHLGYEAALRNKGLEVPLKQFEEVLEELKKIIEHIQVIYGKIEGIVFLGDVKHHFNYLATEKEELRKLLSFLKKYLEENKISFIRGNHEKNEKSGKYQEYFILKDIAFIHGNKEFLEIYDKKINIIVMGHLHPTVTISDKAGIKKEKYKCFLVGKHNKKEIVILPSFINITEGVSANEFSDESGYDFSIIPTKELENFEVFVVQEPDILNKNNLGALDFGKLREI